MTIDIREGIQFVMSHIEQSQITFPRRIYTPKTRQITVYSEDEVVEVFRSSGLEDCRINLYPSNSRVAEGHHPPNILFIDLDMKKYLKNGNPIANPALTVAIRLKKTLDKIEYYFGERFYPSVITSGSGGYHIILPLEAQDLKNLRYGMEGELVFMKCNGEELTGNPNRDFLRFLEPYVCPWADSEHYDHVSMNNYLVRVPGSINSKTNTEVKISQRWNNKSPNIKHVYGDFLAYLIDRNKNLHNNRPTKQRWLEYCEREAMV